jgi:hypothetical protein
MVWRVKLVAELEPSLTTEVEVARFERDEQAGRAVIPDVRPPGYSVQYDVSKTLTSVLSYSTQ